MKVLVVDDEPDVGEVVSLCFSLRWPEAEIVRADSGGAGLKAFEQHGADIVVLDIGLPDMDGYAVLRELRRASNVPVVMLTARDSEVDKVRGLELGADDYITKPFSHIELLARVRAVLRRTQSPTTDVQEEPFVAGDLSLDYASRTITVRGQPVKLTPIEYGLLYELTHNPGRVLTFHQLLAKVWGREYVSEVDYLKVHIQHLRQKLSDDGTLIINERGVGYRFARQPDSAHRPTTAGPS